MPKARNLFGQRNHQRPTRLSAVERGIHQHLHIQPKRSRLVWGRGPFDWLVPSIILPELSQDAKLQSTQGVGLDLLLSTFQFC
jgi:hypothetical protein